MRRYPIYDMRWYPIYNMRRYPHVLYYFSNVKLCLHSVKKKGGSVPPAKMLLVPMNFFLCWVDYASEENLLTEQMPIFAAFLYWEVVTHILIFFLF